MKKILWVLAFSLFFVFNSCTEHPTEVLDTSETQSVLSKESNYVPGTDITTQLREDLTAGLDIKLPAGHFYLSENIIVLGYSGTIKGAGVDETIIQNNPTIKFKATEDPVLPSGFEFSEMLVFYFLKGDVAIRDMSFRVIGDAPAEVHNNPWFGDVTTIDNVIVISGVNEEALLSSVKVTFENLKIIGEVSTDPSSFMEKNMVIPIVLVSTLDGDPNKAINTVITDCVIENFGYCGIEMAFNPDGKTLIQNNVINAGNGQFAIYHLTGLFGVNNVVFRDNHILGNSIWGVNGYYGVYGWIIEQNTFENISTTAAPLTFDTGINDAIIRNNNFVNASSIGWDPEYPWGLITMNSDGSGTTIENNNYNLSGVPGWSNGGGCILLLSESSNYTLNDHNYPVGTNMCDQILNFGSNNSMPSGWQGVCNPIPDNVRQNYLVQAQKLDEKKYKR